MRYQWAVDQPSPCLEGLARARGFHPRRHSADWAAGRAFWCDQVEPAVRGPPGRKDLWGVGLPMSAAGSDTMDELFSVPARPRRTLDHALMAICRSMTQVRSGKVAMLKDYTTIRQKGCTPPDATEWSNIDNNEAFLAQTVVMTANTTLSIPAALRNARFSRRLLPECRHDRVAKWCQRPPAGHRRVHLAAVVFRAGRNPRVVGDFVRFSAEKAAGRLADSSPATTSSPIRKLVEQLFWLDPRDPHQRQGGHPDPDPTASAWKEG